MSNHSCANCFHELVCRYQDNDPGVCSDFVNKLGVRVYATPTEIDQGTRRLNYLCTKLVDLREKFEKNPDFYTFKEIMNFHKEED